MAVFNSSGPSPGSSNVTVQGARNPFVANIAMASANTEYSFTLPDTAVKFLIRLRDDADLQLSYVFGASNLTYISVPRYSFYSESELTLSGPQSLYFQANKPGQVAELVYWTA